MDDSRAKKNQNNPSLFGRLQQSVNYLRECPLCKASYAEEEVDILFEQENVHLVHITCPTCKNKLVAILAASALGMSSVGMVTDLNADDVMRTQELEPVSEENVLSFHSFLAKQPQRFLHLFDTNV